MVKEVEFSNVVESYSATGNMPVRSDIQSLEGYLYNEAKNLVITPNIPLPKRTEGARVLILYYANMDFENQTIEWYHLFTSEPSTCSIYNYIRESYDIDISAVETIPKKIYNTGGTSEIVIEIYTYEANLTTDYGSKRLSAPYTIDSNELYRYDKSTDGIYKLFLVDIPVWAATTRYYIGDVVIYDGANYKCVNDNTGIVPSDEDYWVAADEEAIKEFSYGLTGNPPINSIISNLMLSHYAKYNIIGEHINKLSFKDSDNEAVYKVINILQGLREKAKFHLLQNQPIEALYQLYNLKIESNRLSEKTEIRIYNIKFTL